MLGIARLADRGPLTAAALAALLLAAAIFVPIALAPLSALSLPFIVGSAAVVAFVILKRGERAALQALGICVALLVLLSLALYGSVVQMPLIALTLWLPAILAAMVLRRSVSLDLAVLAISACGVLTVLGVHLLAGGGELWRAPLTEQLSRQLGTVERVDVDPGAGTDVEAGARGSDGAAGTVGGAQGLTPEQLETLVDTLSNMMSGAMGASVMAIALAALFLARYWQAAMVRPGGFREEFHALSLGRGPAIVCAVTIGAAVLAGGRLLDALAIVAVFAFFVQGLAVAHAVVRQRGLAKGWLIGLYAFLLLPHTMLLLAALGLADNVFRLRDASGGGTPPTT